MDRGHQDLIQAIRTMIDATGTLQVALAANASLLEECLTRLEDDQDPVVIVRSIPVSYHRATVHAADEALDDARTRFRVHLIAACMMGGMSCKELASHMGFSPQLVSRHIRASEASA